MYLPPLQLPSNADICVSGDVTIHESAAIASGTILRAAPNSRIIIGAAACIGTGTILCAYQGSIEVETGAILGAGVLIVGNSHIGKQANIGATTTIFNTSVAANTLIPSGSILGDPSRQIPTLDESEPIETAELIAEPEVTETETASEPSPEPEVEVTTEATPSDPVEASAKAPVVGQVYINQLLLTLFPQSHSVKGRSPE